MAKNKTIPQEFFTLYSPIPQAIVCGDKAIVKAFVLLVANENEHKLPIISVPNAEGNLIHLELKTQNIGAGAYRVYTEKCKRFGYR